MSQDESTPRDFLPALQRTLLKSSPFFDYIRNSDFKRLLGKIMSTLEQEKAQSLAILSSEPKEGKTFLVSAMALGYAVLLQKRVLIVNTVLDYSPDSLLLQSLYETELQYAPVYSARATRHNRMIDLISPKEHESKKSQFDTVDFMVGEFLNTFKNQYDLILVDTCALSTAKNSVMDPIVIAGQTDASIMVTSELSLERDAVAGVKALLEQWKVRVLGTIHNAPKAVSKEKRG